MKLIKNITKSLVAGVIMIFMSACEPIEDRDTLKNNYDPDDIEVEYIQSSNGTGNGVTLKMNSPEVIGYWDYKLGRTTSPEITFVSPFMGDVTFDFYVSTPYLPGGNLSERETVVKSVVMNIQVVDNEINEAYYDLVGDNLEGKTWVFDKDGGGLWWYMSNPSNWQELWWNAGNDAPPADADGKMVFDLSGAANFTHYTNASDATGTSGGFTFNSDFTKITISGTEKILGNTAALGSPTGEYNIVILEPDKMVLQIPGNANCGTCGHVWIFVPQP